MKRRVLPICGLLALALVPGRAWAAGSLEEGLRALATQLAESMAGSSVRKLAVVEFSDLNGYRSALGPFIAEELTTQLILVKPGAFDIVERQQLVKILQEQKLSSTSLFDADTIANIGKILGIQAIVTGSIADLGEEIKINARSISVETARVFAAGSTNCVKKGVVESLMRQGAAPESPGARPTEGGRPQGRQIQSSDVFFQNDVVRLTVDSLAVAKNKKSATLALRVENLTNSDLFLAVEQKMQHCRTGLIDNHGNELRPDYYQRGAVGIVCLDPYKVTAEDFTKFAAKGRSTILFPFELGRGEEVSGNVFSFSSEFLMFQSGKVVSFSAGISNIELQK